MKKMWEYNDGYVNNDNSTVAANKRKHIETCTKNRKKRKNKKHQK